MRVTVTFEIENDEVRNLRLAELVGYMQEIGWSQHSGYGANASIFRHEDGLEVLVPNREEVSDYVPVVRDVLETVARQRKTSADCVYRDVIVRQSNVAGDDVTIAPDLTSGYSLCVSGRPTEYQHARARS